MKIKTLLSISLNKFQLINRNFCNKINYEILSLNEKINPAYDVNLHMDI